MQAFFAVIEFAVSIAVAQKNSTSSGGYKSASFAAIWAMFLVLLFTYVGYQVVFRGQASPMQVGILIGAGAMLTQLFFVLMVIFFILASESSSLDPGTNQADNAYGSFAFFNMIIYFVWTIILTVHRKSITIADEKGPSKSKPMPADVDQDIEKPMPVEAVRLDDETDKGQDL